MRLTERCLHSDPPTADEVADARAVVREALGEALRVVPVEHARTWVGVAGTFTTISALAQRMTTYDSDAIHLSRVGFDDLLPVCDELIAMTRKQRAALGPMHEGRVDVIGGGAIVVEELARELGAAPASTSWSSASTTSSTASRCRSPSSTMDSPQPSDHETQHRGQTGLILCLFARLGDHRPPQLTSNAPAANPLMPPWSSLPATSWSW